MAIFPTSWSRDATLISQISAFGLLLTAASSRFIYFVVDERYFENPWLRPFAKWAGLVPLPAGSGNPVALKKAFAQAQAVLERGDVLCVFPEGRMTGTGALSQFRAGYRHLLPPGGSVPVVPVHLGLLWGSLFSRFHRRPGLRLPRRLPYPVHLAFSAPLAPDLTPGALRLAVAELAATAASAAAPGERTLAEQFIRQAHRRPFARRFQDAGGTAVSSLELLTLAYHLAADIRRRAAPDERYVGLLLPTSTGGAAMFLAALLADRVPVFLNYTASREALAHAGQRCGFRRIYTQSVADNLFLTGGGRLPGLRAVIALFPHAQGVGGNPLVHHATAGTQ
jgi:acyl-[acyl-carrier-protein]-phospholipid O-acyltransferase/long-chain-fatty-acid--[acyl-carrier-protein] ligase